MTGDLSLKTIQGVTKNAEKSITESDWEDYINLVKKENGD